MIGRPLRGTRRQLDEGAVLVFALIIVTTVALVVGTVLTRGDGSLRATVALRNVAASSYTADAAANLAINDVRTGYGFSSSDQEQAFNNNPSDGLGCFGHNGESDGGASGDTNDLSLNGFYPAAGSVGPSSAYVECAAETSTGEESSPVQISADNKAAYAVITLGGDIANTGSQHLNVHGGVYSNGNITGAVDLDLGDAHAYGSCTQTTTVAPGVLDCNNHTLYADPNYAPDLSSVPTLQTPPTTCTSGVAVFQPGYYNNVTTLNAAMTACSLTWFKPGSYYFDFQNGCGATPYCASSDGTKDVWTIDTGSSPLVAGTPTKWLSPSCTDPSNAACLPDASVVWPDPNTVAGTGDVGGHCVSPADSATEQGVQFMFGGDSQIFFTKNAKAEICGTYHQHSPPIALFGLETGTTPSATTTTVDYTDGGGTVTPGLFAGATAGLKKGSSTGASWTRNDGVVTPAGSCNPCIAAGSAYTVATTQTNKATWSPASSVPTTWSAQAANNSGTITATGFSPSAAIPTTGAILNSATVKVTNSETGGAVPPANVSLTIGSTTVTSGAGTTSAGVTTYPFTLTAALTSEIATHGYSSARVMTTVSGPNKSSVTISSIQLLLDISWPATGNPTPSTTLQATGFNPSGGLPAHAVLTGATLHVEHSETKLSGSSGQVSLTMGGLSMLSSAQGSVSPSTTRTDLGSGSGIDLTNSANWATLVQQIYDGTYNGNVNVSYVASQDNGETTTVGPITLDLTYYLPALRPQSGCIVKPLASGGCSFLKSLPTGNNKVTMYLEGATYAPKADISLTQSNFGAQVMNFGIISRQVEFNIDNGNPRYTGPAFKIPDSTYVLGYRNNVVQMKVHVCLGEATVTSTCKANAPTLTTRVQFWDPVLAVDATGNAGPIRNQRQVTVLSWSHSN